MATNAQPSRSRLAGKVAVVTGANRGIGLAISRALAAEQCSLVISGRNGVELAAASLSLAEVGSPRVMPVTCDVRDADAVAEMFSVVARDFGRLDILINNAGISQSAMPLENTPVELWREIIETNLTGTFLCCRAAVPLMQAGSTILNIVSVAARDSFPGYSPYNASKSGVLGMTFTLRQELKDRGIRVTALLPGATDTEIWQQVMPDAPRDKMIEVGSVAALVLEAVLLAPKANLSELILDPMTGPM